MKRVISMMLVITLVLGLGSFGFASGSGYDIQIMTNQEIYEPGSEVKISGLVLNEQRAYSYGSVQVKVTDSSGGLICVKDLVADASGAYNAGFRLSEKAQAGSYGIEANFGNVVKTKLFSVGKSNGFESNTPAYKKGSKVTLKGTLKSGDKIVPYGNGIVKVVEKSSGNIIYVKDFIADSQAKFEFDFVVDKAVKAGDYTAELYFNNIKTEILFSVQEVDNGGSTNVMNYQVEGTTDKTAYKVGENVKLSGTASTTKDGVKVAQKSLDISLKLNGTVINSQKVKVSGKGDFTTTFSKIKKAGNYEITLKNETAEKTIKIVVSEKDAPVVTPGGGNGGSGGGSVGGGGSGSSAGGSSQTSPTPVVVAKSTSTSTPSLATISTNVANILGNEEKTSATLSTKEIEQIKGQLKKETSGKVELEFNLGTVKTKQLDFSIPVMELKAGTDKSLSVTVVLDGIKIKMPIDQVKPESSKDLLNMTVLKDDSKKPMFGKDVNVHAAYTVLAKMTSGSAPFDKQAMTIQIDMSKYAGNKEKTVLATIDDKGNLKIVGNRVVGGVLTGMVNEGVSYAVIERNILFTDVQQHWAKSYIESMASKSVVAGYDSGVFEPEKTVTRAEFVTMLVKALNIEVTSKQSNFKDVGNDYWASAYIEAARANNLVVGSNGVFSPNAKITRSEMAVMIAKAMNATTASNTTNSVGTEATPKWASASIDWVVSESLMKGNDGKFRPNDATTRAESATVIYNVFNKQ